MDAKSVVELRLSYREAARQLGVAREAISEIAKRRGLERDEGKPLDLAGFREIACILNVSLEGAGLAS